MSERTLIVTSFPPSWRELADITTATHRRYCDTHGYAYFADCSDVSARVESPWVDDKNVGHYAPLRTMIKFPLLEHFMTEASCKKQYDRVVWLDADLVVSRYDLPLSTWDGDVVLAADVNGTHPTVIMVRNNVTTRGLVWACKEAGNRMFMQHGWSDIMALRFFLSTPPYDHLVKYYSAKELCAMPPGVYPIPEDVRAQYEWDESSFSLHLSALSLEKRIEMASAFVKERNLL